MRPVPHHVVVPIGSHSHRLEIATIESVTAAEHGFDQLQGVLRLGIVRRSLHDSVGLRWAWRETVATGRFGEKMDARLRSKAEHVEEHPDLHRRAVLDPAEVAVSKRDPLARWRDTPQAFREDAAEMTGMRNPDLILPHAAQEQIRLPVGRGQRDRELVTDRLLCGIETVKPPDRCRRMHDNIAVQRRGDFARPSTPYKTLGSDDVVDCRAHQSRSDARRAPSANDASFVYAISGSIPA